MLVAGTLIEIERMGKTLLYTPIVDLRELHVRELEFETTRLLDVIDASVNSLVLDLSRMDHCGSTALSLFMQLWRKLKRRNGRMLLCNVSFHTEEILRVVRLHELWNFYPSREAALQALGH